VTKCATLLGILRATVSKIMSAYMIHGKTISANRNSGKKSTLAERDRHTLRRIVSKKSHNYCSTGDRIEELNIHLEDHVSTKIVLRELNKSNINGRAAIAKPLITESNAQMCRR
jgi:hypothetical protein